MEERWLKAKRFTPGDFVGKHAVPLVLVTCMMMGLAGSVQGDWLPVVQNGNFETDTSVWYGLKWSAATGVIDAPELLARVTGDTPDGSTGALQVTIAPDEYTYYNWVAGAVMTFSPAIPANMPLTLSFYAKKVSGTATWLTFTRRYGGGSPVSVQIGSTWQHYTATLFAPSGHSAPTELVTVGLMESPTDNLYADAVFLLDNISVVPPEGYVAPGGVSVGSSTLIPMLDYSDTFTRADQGGSNPDRTSVYPPNEAARAIENCHGNAARTWSSYKWSFNIDTDVSPGGHSGGYPGNSNAGSVTGFTQCGGTTPYGLQYNLRDNFTVQCDIVTPGGYAAIWTGSANDAMDSAHGLAVRFNATGTVTLYNTAVGETDAGIATGLMPLPGGNGWYNYAVRFDLVAGLLDVYLGQVHKGQINLHTLAGGAYWAVVDSSTNDYVGVGGGSDDRLWTDNFQVGGNITVATPTFTPGGGSYSCADPTVVTIACATSGATIRYTTDGSDPSEDPANGTVIASGDNVTISATTTLKAKAWVGGADPSAVQSAVYAVVYNQGAIPHATLAIDGNLSDWPAAGQWSPPFVFWSGTGPSLNSLTQAKFAWNDAADLLCVAVRTNEAVVRPGGHLVIGLTKDTGGVPLNSDCSTQLCFEYNTSKPHNIQIENEIERYGLSGATTGILGACTFDGDNYTYEVAIPFWSNWVDGTGRQSLSASDTVYVYVCMEDVFEGAKGTDLSFYGNPRFYQGANATPDNAWTRAAALSLSGSIYTASDLSVLLAAMDTASGDADWNPLADLDLDGAITSTDLALLLAYLPY